jgi:tRNA threonylcarbamoyladenosine biosynthesis protein TsaE
MDIIFTLNEIDKTAKILLEKTTGFKVIALHGEMGAGKTTFVHALCNVLGVKDNIGSPTFSIINQYETSSAEIIYHIDLYRLKDEDEAIQTGVEDCLYSGNYCFIEWPDRAPAIFSDNTLHVTITTVNNDTRKLTINL